MTATTTTTNSKSKRSLRPVYTPRALKAYWMTERYGITHTAVLCPTHLDSLFRANPSAYGAGEYSTVESCEVCQGRTVPAFRAKV